MVKTIGIKSGKYKVFTMPDFIKSKIGDLSFPKKRFVNATGLEKSQVTKMCKSNLGYCNFVVIKNKSFMYRCKLRDGVRRLSRFDGVKSGNYQVTTVSDYIDQHGLERFCKATGKIPKNVNYKMPNKDTDYIIVDNKLFLYRFDIDLTKAKDQ